MGLRDAVKIAKAIRDTEKNGVGKEIKSDPPAASGTKVKVKR